MITFLEYSYNLEQVSSIFKKMAEDKFAKPDEQKRFILGMIPVDFMDKLPDGSRGYAASVLRNILIHDTDSWDKLKSYVMPYGINPCLTLVRL
jgi:hypothetical protein